MAAHPIKLSMMAYPTPDFDLSLDWSTSNPWATHLQDNVNSLPVPNSAMHSRHPYATRITTLDHDTTAPLTTSQNSHARGSWHYPHHGAPQAQVFSIERNAGESIIIVIPSPPSHSAYHVQLNRVGSANFGPNYGQIHQDGIEDLQRGGRMDAESCSEGVSEDNGRRRKGLWGMIVGLFQ